MVVCTNPTDSGEQNRESHQRQRPANEDFLHNGTHQKAREEPQLSINRLAVLNGKTRGNKGSLLTKDSRTDMPDNSVARPREGRSMADYGDCSFDSTAIEPSRGSLDVST